MNNNETEQIIEALKQRQELVEKDDYLNWFINFTEQNGEWIDRDAIQDKLWTSKVDLKNLTLIAFFKCYLLSIAQTQNIKIKNDFSIYFTYNDIIYNIRTIIDEPVKFKIKTVENTNNNIIKL